MTRKSFTFGVIALAMLLVGAYAFQAFYVRSPSPPLAITISRLPTPHSGLLHIAEAKGYFAEEGLSATLTATQTGYEAITQVLDGKADVGATAETPIARALAEGKQPKVIATIFMSQWNSGIVARTDRGIAAPADLKGKRIGYVSGTATHYMLETFLAFHRIPLQGVTLVKFKPDEIVDAIVSGKVDAASIWTPFLTEMQKKLGDQGLTFPPKDFYSEMFNLVVRADYSREATDRLLRALLKAERFASSHPDEAVKIVAAASRMDVAALQGHGDPLTFEVTLQQALLLAVENEIRWHFRRGLVPGGPFPDVLAAFETQPLRALKPAGVSIVK